jgi:type II secretory pathway pseudopilin PulG
MSEPQRSEPGGGANGGARSRPFARAYLLLEAMVSGAIVAVGLLGVAVQLGAARDAEIRAERRGVATVLAKAAIDERRALPFNRLAEGDVVDNVQAGGGTYTRRVAIRQGEDRLTVDVADIDFDIHATNYGVRFKQIVVDISFGDRRPVVVRLESRVYEEPSP